MGDLHSHDFEATLMNCVNYGAVTNAGVTTSNMVHIGGIAGHTYENIKNCVNYGDIVQVEKIDSFYVYIGGISGYNYDISAYNCVNFGNITANTDTSSASIGTIFGYITSEKSVHNCFYDKKLDDPNSNAQIRYLFNSFYENFTLSEEVTIGDYRGNSLIDALNAVSDYSTEEYSKWFLNKDRNDISFTVNNNIVISLDSPLILLPNVASSGNKRWFDG